MSQKYNGSIVILQRTLPMDFWKVIYENVGKETFISQQTYLCIRVTAILKFYEVLFCRYCKDLFCL